MWHYKFLRYSVIMKGMNFIFIQEGLPSEIGGEVNECVVFSRCESPADEDKQFDGCYGF